MIFTVYKRYVYFESSACYKFACKSHGFKNMTIFSKNNKRKLVFIP